MRSEVEALLASLEEADSFFETPPSPQFTTSILVQSPERVPEDPTADEGQSIPPGIHIPGLSSGRREDFPRVPGYEIISELGRGGMGVVYRARQVAANRVVALKTIYSEQGGTTRERFQREAEAIALVEHPGIIPIYDVGEADGMPYFSMELCSEGNLDDYLDGMPLPAMDTARLVAQVSRAMGAAHDLRIIHRDLKPANVLLARNPDYGGPSQEHPSTENDRAPLASLIPKVIDFGLAKQIDEVGLTQTGAALGTPSYMSPEQIEGTRNVGIPSDIYALGGILYECLTGRPPFQGSSPLVILLQVRGQEPVSPRLLQPATPKDLETICLKCLEKNPSRRYASAAELTEDLERFLAGRPITARPVSTLETAVKWVKRRPTQAVALALMALLMVVIPTAVIWTNVLRTQKAEEEAARATAEAEVSKAQQADRYRQLRNRDEITALFTQLREAIQVGDVDNAEVALGQVSSRMREGGADDLTEELTRLQTDEHHQEAIRFNPKDPRAHREFGDMLRQAGRVDEAIEKYRDAIELDPKDRITPEILGKMLEQQGDIDGAITEYRRVLDLDSKRLPVLMCLGRLFCDVKNKPDVAEQYFRQAVELAPRHAIPHYNLGIALTNKGGPDDIDGAIEEFRTVIKLEPKNLDAYVSLGTTLCDNKNDYDAAEKCFRTALEINPDHPVIHFYLGIALVNKEDVEGAIAAFNAALKMDPKFTPAKEALDSIHSKKDQPK